MWLHVTRRCFFANVLVEISLTATLGIVSATNVLSFAFEVQSPGIHFKQFVCTVGLFY